MDNIALGRRISPSDTNKSDIAITLLMCHEAIALLQDIEPYSEPPRLVEDAESEVRRLACEIYLALTGDHITNWESERDRRVRLLYEEVPF